MMRTRSLFVLGILATVVLAACGRAEPAVVSTSAPTATKAAVGALAVQPTEVRVFVPSDDNLQWMNFWVALGAGFFRDEGLDVQLVLPPNPGGGAQLLLQDKADVAVMPRPMSLNLIGQGRPILLFANLLANDPINLVVRKEIVEQRGLSTDTPLAERLVGLRGLRVGVAHGPPSRLRVLFASVGLDADRDIEMVVLHGEEQNQAFADGSVDALYAHTPFLEKALIDQGAVLIVNQSAGEVPGLANRQHHNLVTTRAYADSNPDELMALTRAIYRAQQLIHADLQATTNALRASGVQLQVPHGLETLVALYEPAIPRTPRVTVEGIQRELVLFPANQTPPDFSGIDLTAHVAPQFAEQVAPSSP